ncbi:hypothetical protein [Flavobacterium terrigena]|uniref:Uncharacterized protein n=1 Tax=Flavobacterium terrigena TaxID=402734 RepID=A0A1H6ST59_9FLAO|nr:hypothetical protein [Flavobacterium terrigena]SEI71103.1 hypothetical protein SAMN05660918_1500 [Flavobacterium terrigena]
MEIKNTFDFYFSFFEKKKLFLLFPNLKEELLFQYNQIVNDSKKTNLHYDFIQRYSQIIETGIGGDFYEISWSIRKIENIISINNLPLIDIDIDRIYSDELNLNPQKLSFYKDKNELSFKPIYVSYYKPIETYIVIDGNHRTNELRRRGDNKVRGYVLSPLCNKEAMNELSFSLYKFHHNLVSLYIFCKTPFFVNIKTEKNFKKNTFYGDSVKFNYLFFKKIIIFFS